MSKQFLLVFFSVVIFSSCSKHNEKKGYDFSTRQEYYDVLQRRNEKIDTGNYINYDIIKYVENENSKAEKNAIFAEEQKNNTEIKKKKNSFLKTREKNFNKNEERKKILRQKKELEKKSGKKSISAKKLNDENFLINHEKKENEKKENKK